MEEGAFFELSRAFSNTTYFLAPSTASVATPIQSHRNNLPIRRLEGDAFFELGGYFVAREELEEHLLHFLFHSIISRPRSTAY